MDGWPFVAVLVELLLCRTAARVSCPRPPVACPLVSLRPLARALGGWLVVGTGSVYTSTVVVACLCTAVPDCQAWLAASLVLVLSDAWHQLWLGCVVIFGWARLFLIPRRLCGIKCW